jgi:AcrR family transcriptional regulator
MEDHSMPTSTASKASASSKGARPTRDRADVTRASILQAATRLFSEQGYEGVSVRDIEKAAEVHRGLVNYHFENKDALWKQVVDAAWGQMKIEFEQRLDILEDVSPLERLSFIIRFYVRFFSLNPEISRLMSQEARQESWRIGYLVDTHIKPSSRSMQKLVGDALGLDHKAFIHWYYIMVSASSTIFSFAPECALLFGVDSRQEDMVKTHADMLVSMMLGPTEKN